MLLIFASCTQNVIEDNITNDVLITESAFQYINTDINDSFSSSIDDSFGSMDTSSCFDDPFDPFDSFDSGCSSFDDW